MTSPALQSVKEEPTCGDSPDKRVGLSVVATALASHPAVLAGSSAGILERTPLGTVYGDTMSRRKQAKPRALKREYKHPDRTLKTLRICLADGHLGMFLW